MKNLIIVFLGFHLIVLFACKKNEKPAVQQIEHTGQVVWEGEMTISVAQKFFRGSTLTIKPGSKITFEPGAKIMSWGDVFIMGTPMQRIQLIAKSPINKHQILQVYGENNQFKVHHTDIIDGLTVSYMSDNHFKDVHFSNSYKLEWNYAMLRIFKSKILIEDCVADWNHYGEGILIHKSDNPIIRNCRFHKLIDAIEFIRVNNGLISNCHISGSEEDGIDFNQAKNCRIENTTFQSVGCAIEVGSQGFGSSDSITIENCVFLDCKTGVYVKESSSVQIETTAFVNTDTIIEAVSHADSAKHTRAYLTNSVLSGGKADFTEVEGAEIFISNTISNQDAIRKGIRKSRFEVRTSDKGEVQFMSERKETEHLFDGLGYRNPKSIYGPESKRKK